ncbi:MAG: periplasmic heavy metal sensor [Candidatus Aminicenantaceae bacterium]
MNAKKILLSIICLLFLCSIFLAASQDEPFQTKRRIRKNINTLRLLRLTQILELTEEQAAKIFPAINRAEKEKMEINREIERKMRELRLALEKEAVEEKNIENTINEVKQLRNQLRSKDEELENFVNGNLSLVQRAKYLLFSVDFNRGLRKKIDKARALQERLRRKEGSKF